MEGGSHAIGTKTKGRWGLSPWAVSFLAGGIAGTTAKTAIAPLERVKILFQIRSKHYPFRGVLQTLKDIAKNEGITALYKGNMATVVRIFPYAAVQFVVYEEIKKFFYNPGERPKTISNLLAGSFAGAVSVLVTYPLDLVRVRLAVAVKTKHFHGVWDAIKTIHNREGVTALYRGISPTMLGILPYAGINFASYEALKHLVLDTRKKEQLNVYERLGCGGLAGAIGQTIAYPLDVVRRQMQTYGFAEGHGQDHKSTWGAVKTIVKTEGLRGLFRGVSINYMKVVPAVSISFATYEHVKDFLTSTS